MNRNTARSGMFSTRRGRGLALAAGTLVLLLAAVSCQTVNRSVVVLPDVPGAKYIGSKECEQCHDKLYRDFATADHARLIAAGTNAINAGCESCHGPCSLHSESGGETKPPYSFTAGRPQTSSYRRAVAGRACAREGNGLLPMPCRRARPVQPAQPSSRAGRADSPAPPAIRRTKAPFTLAAALRCCPKMKAASAAMPPSAVLTSFEHDALREGCTTCHNVHGSVNAKLLTVRDANLCLKCHFQQVSRRQASHRGFRPHVARAARHLLDGGLSRGGPWFPGESLFAVLTTQSNSR